MASYIVAGETYVNLDGQLHEIKRQIRQRGGYPHDPALLSEGLQRLIEGDFGQQQVVETKELQQAQPQSQPPLILTSTGPTFGDWLKAREKLHKFLTGEIVILRDMFVIPEETIARTDIMPVFRPAGATNRMAVDWKKKLGIDVREEIDVMEYENSKGPKVPQLSFINRSITPDADTLGKSPIDLRKVRMKSNQAWLNLYGWSDAHSLYFKIIGKHLDYGNTWTWFPDDVLPVGKVAFGCWLPGLGEVRFCWSFAGLCDGSIGARLTEFFPLKT